MEAWKGVLDQAARERDRIVGFRGRQDPGIEDYYPEIRRGDIQFTNTLGSNLLPDLLTSEGVIVDLYAWPNPAALLTKYGVDLPFLLRLRDAKLVVLCANLEPERYIRAEWLYPVLADKRTIFRSLRTPAFFAEIDPDFARRQADTKAALRRAIEGLNDSTVRSLIRAMAAAAEPSNADEASSALSMWLERLAVFEPDDAQELSGRIMAGEVEAIHDLRRCHRSAVSPHSEWLGGEAKTPYESWRDLFPECIDTLTDDDHLRFSEILSWMSEMRLGATANDFQAADWWGWRSEAELNRLLKALTDISTRRDLIEAEAVLRRALISPSTAITREAISTYVDTARRQTERFHSWSAGLPAALAGAFGCLSDQWVAGAVIGLGSWLACERFVSSNAKRLAEAVWPKLRLVRLIKSE